MKAATQAPPQTETKKTPSILQQIRQRFTSGRPRVMPDTVGPMLAVQLANAERDKIRDFVSEKNADASNFTIKVWVVTATEHGPDVHTFKSHSWSIPETGMKEIVAVADKLTKAALMCVGFLVIVTDKKTGLVLRYQRPFIESATAHEFLAYASLAQRFGKEVSN